MRILIAGAGGFIGGRIAAELQSAGHDIVACGRDPDRLQRLFPNARATACDFAKDSAADWRARFQNVDAVVNAAGIFRGRGADSFEQVHIAGPAALFEACAGAGVPKLIQISALGAGEGAQTPFHLTKGAADECCMKLAQEHGLSGWTVDPAFACYRPGRAKHRSVCGARRFAVATAVGRWMLEGAAGSRCGSCTRRPAAA